MAAVESLFGSSTGSSAGAPEAIEIKAGQCALVMQENGKYMVTPKPEKGLISLKKGDNAAFTSFSWKDRNSGNVELDYVLMPNSLDLVKVNTGKETDRVYRLKWKNSAAGAGHIMFWMQDKNETKDEKLIKDFNERVADPRKFNPPRPAGGINSMYGLHGMLPGMGGMLPPPPASAQARSPPGTPPGDPPGAPGGGLDFSALMMGASAAGASSSGALGAAGAGTGAAAADPQAAMRAALSAAMAGVAPTQAARTAPIRLENTVTAERVLSSGILEDATVRRALVELLPAGQMDEASLEANLRSPQLQQAMGTLTGALASENYNSVFANLGVDPAGGSEHLLRGDVVRAFLEALRQAYPEEASASESDSGAMDQS